MTFTRRDFLAITVGSAALGTACHRLGDLEIASDGRLTARPRNGVKTTGSGQIKLGLDVERDAILQIPRNGGQAPLPLLVLLHGATQSAEDMFWYFGSAHEEAGVAVLAPNSRDTTWDAIGGSFGPDVALLNRALDRVFEKVGVDPARLSIGGFSDGATYALALGLTNADLFSSVVAFSPGFLINVYPHGRPRFFISHGTRDHILPIDRCGRRLAAGLISNGYDVKFREFDGDHEIPPEVAREALKWVAGT
ncbi:MAG TPA: alpha/beta hydrolase-fold protein [Pyrinomonadaceae bacterium]|jgi:predicted esterase